jgi:hypothetical protein
MDQTLNTGSFLLSLADGMIFQVTKLGHETVIARTTRKGEVVTDIIQWAGKTYQGLTDVQYRVATLEDIERVELASMLVDELVEKTTPSPLKYKGAVPRDEMPFKRGQEIILPKGTPVRSLKRGDYVTTRKQTIKVHSFGGGMSTHIGYCHDGVRRSCRIHTRNEEDTIKGLYGTNDMDVLVHHPDAVVRGIDIFLPLQPPTVVWPGTGGYWCEADINLLLEANGVA